MDRSEALNWLDGTDFWNKFSDRIGNALRKSVVKDKEGRIKHIPQKEWEDEDKWIFNIFLKLKVLSYHLFDLQAVENSIRLPDIDKFLNKNQIEVYSFLKYTYENHQIRVVSTLDLCSKLGNVVFKQNIKDRYCNWYQFSNKLGKSHLSSEILVEFAKAINQNIGERNSIVHSGDYVNEILDWYNTYEIDDEYLKDDLLIESFKKYRDIERAKLEQKMSRDSKKCYLYSERFVNSLLMAFI